MLLEPDRLEVVAKAYDRADHRSIYVTRGGVSEGFRWQILEEDVKRFENTCHECQTMSMEKILLPLTISVPATVFANVKVLHQHDAPPSFRRLLIRHPGSLQSRGMALIPEVE